MEKYHVGALLIHLLEQTGMAKKDLVEGIMDVSNFWKIESGFVTPSKENLELMLQRLGVNPHSLSTFFLNSEDTEIQKLKDSVETCLVRRNVEEANKFIAKLASNKKFMKDSANRQFVLSAKASNAANANADPNVIIEMLQDAIFETLLNFNEDKIEKYLLTKTEFAAIQLLALQYFYIGQKERSVSMLYALKKNVEDNCIDKIERGKRYPYVILNLTNHLCSMEKYDEVINLCNQGIEVCLDTGYLSRMPGIVYNKACSFIETDEKEAGAELLRDAYYSARLFMRHNEAKIIKNYAQEHDIVF